MEARLEEVPRDREVPVIGRRHRDEVDPLLGGQGQLGLDHVGVGAVHAFGVQGEILAHVLGLLRIDIERAGHQLDLAIETRGLAMDLADKCPGASADQTHSQLPVEFHTCSFQLGTAMDVVFR